MYSDDSHRDRAPFQNVLDPHYFHESSVHEEALARMFFLVERQRRCGVLSGPPGVGKSLLLRILQQQSRRSQRETVYLDLTGVDGPEMLWKLLAELRQSPAETDSSLRLWNLAQDYLCGARFTRRPTVVLLDHLDAAHFGCLSTLNRLLQLDAAAPPMLTAIVAVRSNRPSRTTAALQELADLQIELPPLDPSECRDYIRTRMERAGCRRPSFEQAALERLAELSGGVPRELNRLCDLALLAAMAEECSTVSAGIVEAVAGELEPSLTA